MFKETFKRFFNFNSVLFIAIVPIAIVATVIEMNIGQLYAVIFTIIASVVVTIAIETRRPKY